MDVNTHQEFIQKNLTSTYRKTGEQALTNINNSGLHITTKLGISDRTEPLSPSTPFFSLTAHTHCVSSATRIFFADQQLLTSTMILCSFLLGPSSFPLAFLGHPTCPLVTTSFFRYFYLSSLPLNIFQILLVFPTNDISTPPSITTFILFYIICLTFVCVFPPNCYISC